MMILTALLVISNLLSIITSPVHTFFNLLLLSGIVLVAILYGEYRNKEKYDYDTENPNALVYGQNIAGTVYVAEPNNVPGLGWIV